MLANVVTSADFNTKPYQLQGLEDVGSSFDDFVTFNQNEILLKLLGQTLYDAFSAGVAALPNLWVGNNAPGYAIGAQVLYGVNIYQSLIANNLNVIPTSDATKWQDLGKNRWAQLLYGDSYTINNRKFTYEGVKAFITPYIYSMWLTKESTSVVSTGGAVSSNSENSSNISPSIKANQAYISFKKLVIDRYHRLGLYFYNIVCRVHPQGTLFGFLFSNDAIYFADVSIEGDQSTVAYLSAHFTSLGSMNDFDL
jgi:hypothetical protein